jgi:SRSO17 transposase
VGVFLAYASPRGRALIDRELYLPKDWTSDRQRCRDAGVPDVVRFATKPLLAQEMVERALEAQVPFAWLTGDEAYGQDTKLRMWLELNDIAHVLAVPCNAMVVSQRLLKERVDRLVAAVEAVEWVRLSCGAGAHGERVYDWTVVPIRPLRRPGWGHWLLARRSVSDPSKLAYYVCFGPADTDLDELIRVAGSRWAIEECFQTAKNETGLDHYQVRGYEAWYRHITLSMLAAAFLVITRDAVKKGDPLTSVANL